MATLRSPKGKLYTTDDPREINDLTVGQGYTVEHDGNASDEQPQPQPYIPPNPNVPIPFPGDETP
jgi:hypothetical protein